MDSATIFELENLHGSGIYPQQPLALVRGLGAHVWDSEGREYIDCSAGHGVANVGHAHPVVVRAVQEQAQRLIVSSNSFYNDVRSQLLAELARITPPGLDRAFLCNSGTEAVEGALKFARLATGRAKIVSTMRGFHGRTFGALSTTWKKEYREPFEPLVPGVSFVPYDRLERADREIDDGTAAVILEVVQGEGGVNPGSGDYLRAVQAMCRERGALLIVDEVQTGYGRTGRMFACEHHGLEPDMMCMAKAMAGGLPMGAVMIGHRVGELPKKAHGSTFGGNPLACAAALATIQVIESEQLAQGAALLGERFAAGLRAIRSPEIREVRALGLMLGVQLKGSAAGYLAALADRGVLALAAGSTVMRFLPPLVISEGDVDTVVGAVRDVLPSAD